MTKKILSIAAALLFSLGLTVLANTTFSIDDLFFTQTGISSWDYSPLHFNFAGNDFDGIMFLGSGISQTSNLTMSGVTINCERQLEWLYINTARWNKVWPLDQNTLDTLSGNINFAWYDTLTMTGWFFTECSWAWIGGDEIYWYLEHTYNGHTYSLWAGVDYDFLSWEAIANFAGTLKYITWANITSSGYIFDNYGGIAKTYSNQDLYGNIWFTGSEVDYTGWTYVTTNTWIQVNIYSNHDAEFEISGDIVSVITGTILAWINQDPNISLTNGTWVKDISLTISTGGVAFVDNISVTLQESGTTVLPPIDDINPTVTLISPANGHVYTGGAINFQWSWTDTGGITWYDLYINNISTATTTLTNATVTLTTNWAYSWYVIATDNSGNTGQSDIFTLTRNGTTTVVAPTLISPAENAAITIGDLLLSWTGTSASGYTYQISTDTSFANIVDTNTTTSTSITPINNPNFMNWLFYWRVIDNKTNAISNYRSINIVLPAGWLDLEVDEFEFNDKDDARLSESYNSNEIRIDWITSNIYIHAELDDNIWALYINDIMVGTEWFVKDGDDVYIELLSDSDYGERTSAKLIVGEWNDEVSSKFRIYTEDEDEDDDDNSHNWDFELTYGQMLQAITLINTLGDMYGANEDKLVDFFNTFLSLLNTKADVLADQIDDEDNNTAKYLLEGQFASVEYLLGVIENYLDNLWHRVNEFYTAPNQKIYEVVVDSIGIHTSPDFAYPKFFPTWDLFKKHIDDRNPAMMSDYGNSNSHGSATIVWNIVTAKNGKTYEIYQAENWLWTCDSFIYATSFSTEKGITRYIDIQNR